MPPRIKYNSINIDFGRDWNTYNDSFALNNSEVQSDSGVSERVNLFKQQFIRAGARLLKGQVVEELDHFFNFVNDGTNFEFWRDFKLGAYFNFEGNDETTTTPSLKSNDGIAATFTRTAVTGSAYYTNPHTGLEQLIVDSVNNLPRHPVGKYGDGIIIEPTRTNLITNRLSNAAWSKTNMTAATSTETVAPAGLTSGLDKLTATSDDGFAEFITPTAINTDDGVFSIWLKSPNDSVSCNLAITDDLTNALALSTVTVTNQWQRFQLVYENTVSDADDWRVAISIADNGDSVYTWFTPQLEVGTDVLFATSPIGAELTASTTRNADRLESAVANVLNKTKGTIAFYVSPQWIYDKHPFAFLFHSDTTGAGRHLSYGITAAGNHELRFYDSEDAIAASISGTASADYTQNTFTRVVITYDSTVSNGLNLYINGTLSSGSPSTNTSFSPAELNTLMAFGSAVSGSGSGVVFDEIEVWRDVKDSTWVNQDFNWGRGKSYGKNYYSSVILQEYKKNERKNGFFDIELVFKEELT